MQGDKSLYDEVKESRGPLIFMLLIYALPWLIGLSGCLSSNATTETDSPAIEQNVPSSRDARTDDWADDFGYEYDPIEVAEPKPLDPNWPTTNPDLLAIPEADRWYNAGSKVGTYGTIAGPVASVYQAVNSPGMPVFVNIGNAYPSGNRAQVIIWGERVAEFEQMLNAIDDGGAWVRVTGYIGSYEGVPQIDVNDGYTEWTWWV